MVVFLGVVDKVNKMCINIKSQISITDLFLLKPQPNLSPGLI
ncbi:hypothetical protein MARINOS108_140050 [Marinoscillum sp. 108]|nr:hypothetical protein MARINOS108_140050 [Marinoscillum sp. 108]